MTSPRNPFDSMGDDALLKLLGGGGAGGRTFDEELRLATAPRSSYSSSSSTNYSTSSQDPAQFAENMKLLREQLRESSLTREQKTAIDTYLAQLQERNQKFVELKSAQDNLIKVAEQREGARQGDNNRKESARQANLKAAVDQYQTALSLIPALGQLSIEESKRTQDILQNGGDFLARAFESRGGTSPLAKVTQADQINAVSSTLARLRNQISEALAGGPPEMGGSFDAGSYQAPELAGFGGLGAMPTLNVPQATPAAPPATAPIGSGGGSGGFPGGSGGGRPYGPGSVGYGGADANNPPVPAGAGWTTGYDANLEGEGFAAAAAPPWFQPAGSMPVLDEATGIRTQTTDNGARVEFSPDNSIAVNGEQQWTGSGKYLGNDSATRYTQGRLAAGDAVAGAVGSGLGKVGGFIGSIFENTPANKRARVQAGGFSGYADGGMTREGAFIVGDHPSGFPVGTEEMVVNPTNAPIRVIPNQQSVGFSRYATGTGTSTSWMPGNEQFAGMDPQQAATAAVPQMHTGAPLPHPMQRPPMPGMVDVTYNPNAPWQTAPGTSYKPQWQIDRSYQKPAYVPPPDPKVTQKELVDMARRMSPPAVAALFNGGSIPTPTALKSTVEGEDVYMKTPTARQWLALSPEERKAAEARYNVEFNAGAGFVPNRIAAQYGSTGGRQRGFVGAAGL